MDTTDPTKEISSCPGCVGELDSTTKICTACPTAKPTFYQGVYYACAETCFGDETAGICEKCTTD